MLESVWGINLCTVVSVCDGKDLHKAKGEGGSHISAGTLPLLSPVIYHGRKCTVVGVGGSCMGEDRISPQPL